MPENRTNEYLDASQTMTHRWVRLGSPARRCVVGSQSSSSTVVVFDIYIKKDGKLDT